MPQSIAARMAVSRHWREAKNAVTGVANLPTGNQWQARRVFLDKLPVFSNFADIEEARKSSGVSLALLRPARIIGLDIKRVDAPNWTAEEKAKLISLQNQAELFDDTDKSSVAQLRKLPYDFHYRYECDTPTGPVIDKRKIVDWEIGVLFWKVHRAHGDAWEKSFRDKLERDLPAKDLMFLLGTIHRFPEQWLIVSLISPLSSRLHRQFRNRCFSGQVHHTRAAGLRHRSGHHAAMAEIEIRLVTNQTSRSRTRDLRQFGNRFVLFA
jgi:hypothetical protein